MPQQQKISTRMKEFGLSEINYWKSTLQSVDAALSMLSAFDGRHVKEIDTAIDSLCKLLAIGDDFDKAKERPQEPRQETNNRTMKPYDTINEIDAFEAQFTRCLQKAIELSIKDFYINQHNSEMKTSDAGKPQNRHNSGDWDFNDAECDYNERQFVKDMKMAIELSLEDKAKKNKAHGTEAHDGASTPVQRDDFSVTNKQPIQIGAFGWVNNSSGAVSWDFFASSTDTKWKQGIDTEIADWEKEQAKNETEALPQGKSVTVNKDTSCLIDSNTCICDDCISVETDGTEDSWTKEEERPDDNMIIFIPRNPIRKSKGPRIFRPDDGDFESDDEEQEEETDG